MHFVFLFFTLSHIFMELVYHFIFFGWQEIDPILMIPTAMAIAAVETLLVGMTKIRGVNLAVFWTLSAVNYLLYGVQVVYYNIFKAPLLLETAFTTGKDALTDFGYVALDGIIYSMGTLAIMALPFAVAGYLLHKDIMKVEQVKKMRLAELSMFLVGSVSFVVFVFMLNYSMETDFYEDYQEFQSPGDIVQKYGMLAIYQRQIIGEGLPELEWSFADWENSIPVVTPPSGPQQGETQTGTEEAGESENTTGGSENTTGGTEEENGSETESVEEETPPEPEIDRSPNVLNIDFDKLLSHSDDKVKELAQIMQALTPTNKNEYTGMFRGYNLIYITAEAFSPYAVSKELTPTLYYMINSGVVVDDYYVPSWQTSTSDGEYVNLFGQIPNGQHSFRRSAGILNESGTRVEANSYPYSLPAYFAAEGAKSYAYHSNSLSYYFRYLTHPNIGYDFKAARLGYSSLQKDYGHCIFQMKGANSWPNSDYEMFVATIPEFINDERFHVYYMTMSGHAGYSFTGNSMAKLNQELVADLDCSEQMKAYIACNYELERAMAYLIDQLEQAGKLDTTVIVLSSDHRPYGIKNEEAEIEAFTGQEMDVYSLQKNSLILWNSQMETVEVEKTCSALDIMPTLLNLFGFEYDSRLFAGRDMLSDAPSLVMFSNKSFRTDDLFYNASNGKVQNLSGADITDGYTEAMKDYVNVLFRYSQGMLTENFHSIVKDAQIPDN